MQRPMKTRWILNPFNRKLVLVGIIPYPILSFFSDVFQPIPAVSSIFCMYFVGEKGNGPQKAKTTLRVIFSEFYFCFDGVQMTLNFTAMHDRNQCFVRLKRLKPTSTDTMPGPTCGEHLFNNTALLCSFIFLCTEKQKMIFKDAN